MSAKRKQGHPPTKEIQRPTADSDNDEEQYNGRNGESRNDESEDNPWNYNNKKGTPPQQRDIPSPMTLQETGSAADETSSSGNKEDEDDFDDDLDDLKSSQYDPERLKAFNMFVRLFVDENLDRMVPISKQPKEKIQAIMDSCTRQFPEFSERARKRIRTYLKSCRRNKRTKDSGGSTTAWPESARPTPAHLTSVQAEHILAQACENESHNAKRMRLGLEPVSQPMPILPGCEAPPRNSLIDHFSPANLSSSSNNELKVFGGSQTNNNGPLSNNNNINNNNNNNKTGSPNNYSKLTEAHSKSVGAGLSLLGSATNGGLLGGGGGGNPSASTTSPYSLVAGRSTTSTSTLAGGGGTHPLASMFHPGVVASSQVAFPGAGPLFQAAGGASGPFHPHSATPLIHNGPTDLSMKSGGGSSGSTSGGGGGSAGGIKPLLAHKLTPTEVAAVRQLITGYRESAAFLLRSADELEQLLLHQA